MIDVGSTVCVIDPFGIAAGASGTPVGLANPATGRFAKKSWEAEKSLSELRSNLLRIQQNNKKPFFKETGILRPALDEKIASKMKQNLSSDNWRNNQVVWLDKLQTLEKHPGLNCENGSIWVKNGITVHLPEYLNALSSYLKMKGCVFYLNMEYEVMNYQNWHIKFSDHSSFNALNLIYSNGITAGKSPIWSDLSFHAVKGQTLILQTVDPLLFEHSVSALGYFSKIDTHSLLLGSTYEHSFTHSEPDNSGANYMLDRLKRVHVELANNSQIISQWAGVRASTPDRKPYVGQSESIPNCFILSGLGSKGLLYSARCGKILTEFMLHGTAIPNEVSIQRFKA